MIRYYPLSLFFPCQANEKLNCAISCTLGNRTFKCTLDSDNTVAIFPIPDGEQKIKYAFVGVESCWVGFPTEEIGMSKSLPPTSGVPSVPLRYVKLTDVSKVTS